GLTEVEDLDDAGAADPAARLRLVEEALERDRVLGDLGAHDLERDVAVDQLVAGCPHGAARTRPEEAGEPVTGLDELARVQRSTGEEVGRILQRFGHAGVTVAQWMRRIVTGQVPPAGLPSDVVVEEV